jgi:DNA invertase Pin-like site-specific DNA recombinase
MTHPRERELRHFLLLDRQQQAQALRRMVASGMSERTVAAASGLSVEQVRRVIAQPDLSSPLPTDSFDCDQKFKSP